MPVFIAILRVLVVIWRAIASLFAWLSELFPILTRIGPWFARFLPFLALIWKYLKSFFASALGFFFGVTLESGGRAVAASLAGMAVLALYAVFLGTVATGVAGMGIEDIYNANPFAGAPAAMMALVVAAFPLKFAVATACAYVSFRLTVNAAAFVFVRAMKMIFGA